MDSVNVYDAKTQLSRLLQRVEAGEEIVIARAGRPIARLVPVVQHQRVPGMWAGRWKPASDWDSPEVNEQITDLFENSRVLPPEDEAT